MIDVPVCEQMPEGWELNPNKERVQSVRVCLNRNFERFGKAYCPCSAERSEATVCPCEHFRAGEGCHCTLYVRTADVAAA